MFPKNKENGKKGLTKCVGYGIVYTYYFEEVQETTGSIT